MQGYCELRFNMKYGDFAEAASADPDRGRRFGGSSGCHRACQTGGGAHLARAGDWPRALRLSTAHVGADPRRLLEPGVRPTLQRSRVRRRLGGQSPPGEDVARGWLRAPDGNAASALDPNELATANRARRTGGRRHPRIAPKPVDSLVPGGA